MLRQVLLSLLVVLTFSVADSGNTHSHQEENKILKLKLKIYELREENTQLKKIIDDLGVNSKEDRSRTVALEKLKRELRMSRSTRR
jgi:hypothetical protein